MKRETPAIVNHSNPNKRELIFFHRELFLHYLKDFKDGEEVRVILQSVRTNVRSPAQNNVFHWYCDLIARYLGMTPADVKLMMKKKFYMVPMTDLAGDEVVDPETGEVFLEPGSTAILGKEEMYDLTQKVYEWSKTFLNYELPLPDSNYKIHFLEEQKQKLKNHGKNN
jgi:hypothetical protein